MNASRRVYRLLLVLSSVAGCGPPHPPGQEQPDRQDSAGIPTQQLSGKVFVTGSEPHTAVTLVPLKGRGVTLVGSLQGELARLSGAEVRVYGIQSGNPPAGGFDVKSYDVTQVDGEVPRVGILTAVGGTLTLINADTVELTNVPEELRRRAGAKVWIVGDAEAGKLAVQSYGVLRESNK
jgi:hypothetical protein